MAPEIHALLRKALYLMQATDLSIKLDHFQKTGQMRCENCTYCKELRGAVTDAIVEIEAALTAHPTRR